MDRFSKFNPKVTFLFFILAVVLTLVFFHPVYLLASLAAGLIYKIKLEGKKAIAYFFKFILPLLVFVSLFNMLFTHYGVTVLFTAFDMHFTLESLFYGFCQGMLFAAMIIWFSCYSRVVTSECFLAVFGRIAPNLSLIFSMVLSFIPRLKKNAEEINDARMLIDEEKSKLRRSVKNFSALLSMTLEESIEVSDSMKARGFGKDRTAYSKYSFSLNDGICIGFMIIIFILLCVMKALGKAVFIFEPVISMDGFSYLTIVFYGAILFLPIIIDLTEDMRWFYLKQKI